MAKSTCSVDGCDRAHVAKGYCGPHYAKVKRYGNPHAGLGKGRIGAAITSKPCRVDGCERPTRALLTGMCRSHHQIFTRTGSTERMAGTVERFEKFYIIAPSGCWEWQGARLGEFSEYGQFSMKGVGRPVVTAHRAAWELYVGEIPDGLTIDHLCMNKICVNPKHLEPVTQAENNRRSRLARGFPA